MLNVVNDSRFLIEMFLFLPYAGIIDFPNVFQGFSITVVGRCTAKSRKGAHSVAAGVPTCFPNGFEWVPVDPTAAPREDCFVVFCPPHRMAVFPMVFNGFR